MENMIAFCGIDCSECGTFKATQNDSDKEREKVAERWSSRGAKVKKEDNNCFGCRSTGKPIFFYCESNCTIRKCAVEKSFSACADCPDFGCEKLLRMFEYTPKAKENLMRLREGRGV